MIILDTNVISALFRDFTPPPVLNWLDSQPASSLWTTSITLMELRYGVEIMAEGKRKQQFTEALEILLQTKFDGRVAGFDSAAASRTAQLMAKRRAEGRSIDLSDSMIAGIAEANRATLATRNVAHFQDLSVPVVNPWE